MPNINLIPETYYQAMMPYHVDYDNLPLRNIIAREEIINDAVDINSRMIRDSIGTAGSLANRLRVSLEDDGTLKTTGINAALHNIAYHTDGSDGIADYVRMLQDERDKLALVSDEATALQLEVHTPSTTISFVDSIVEVQPTDTITWEVTAPNKLKAHMAFPTTAVHRHYYGLTPVSNTPAPDYTHYRTTSLSTIYIADTLRVYINGVRIYSDDEVYVPDSTMTNWTLTSFTDDNTTGTFFLNRAITVNDVIRIDFDTLFL